MVEKPGDLPSSYGRRQRIGLLSGPVVLLVMLGLPAPEGMSEPAWATAAVGSLMAVWWITEAIPIPVTALLPVPLFPLLGVGTINEATSPYANPLIFLFMGGFMIALAMQRWGLHRRIALAIIGRVGPRPNAIIFGFMLASAFLSMWVSNTATALMMLPIAMSVINLSKRLPQTSAEEKRALGHFGIALALAIAYACNVGGMGTLIGTPPNALMAAFILDNYDIEIGFGQWMLVGVPLVALGLPLAFFVLTRLSFPVDLAELPGGSDLIRQEAAKLGPMRGEEFGVAVVFGLTAALWIFRQPLQNLVPGLSDAVIAIAAGIALILIPSSLREGKFLLDWESIEKLPWGILILFGGGLSLAAAFTRTGLDESIGMLVVGFDAWPTLLLLALSVIVILVLTEMTSNTATAAAFLPILAAAAVGIGENPLLFIIPAALAASCAFMLPVATPPNAIVYGSGLLTVPMMVKAGMLLNLFFIVIVLTAAYTLLGWVFGTQPGVLPEWAV
ncbi:SLC13 family permease [Wenzhouxiangella limi]|uniref:DASS family sodium-coupled anion symporter n=1 Tax=Wenzhouxiangella limi TaxID=2707351 RepID=A0A845V628_9GAMM|nr:DASS family sodium-coupled anion symporter [Wenzhouxiangella limi]NDY95425.1 DASS family sodium-coupled anion symporter [Wenzhouxiangella limi]